jgi:flagellar capping protein FliD
VAATKFSRALDDSLTNLSVGSGLSQLESADIGLSRDRSGKLFVSEARLSQQALAEPDALNDFFNLASSKLDTQLKTSMKQQSDYAYALQGVRSMGSSPLASQSVASLLQLAGANFSLPINARAAVGVLQYMSIAQLQ